MLKLLNFPQSTCSQKVRLTLWEKSLDFEDRPLNSAKREHLQDWYLKLNPNGVVPTLLHDDAVDEKEMLSRWPGIIDVDAGETVPSV